MKSLIKRFYINQKGFELISAVALAAMTIALTGAIYSTLQVDIPSWTDGIKDNITGVVEDINDEENNLIVCTHGNTATVNTPGSCIQHSLEGRVVCLDCNYIINEGTSSGYGPHGTLDAVGAVKETCTTSGSTGDKVCLLCKETVESAEIIPATGHTEVIEATVAATCTETGLTEGKHCSVCNEILVAQQTVAALGHDYKGVVTAPSCTETGYTTYTCSRCSDSYVDNETAATDHSYGEWAVTTAATCTAKGTERRDCNNCDHYETRDVAATGHTEGNSVVENNIDAACTTNGSYDTVVYCTACDTELSRVQAIVSATGHTEELRNAVEGYSGDTYCSVCNTKLASGTYTEYTITYNVNEGTMPSGYETTYTLVSETITLPTPTREGYTFEGWYEEYDFSGAVVTEVTKGSTDNKILYAKWKTQEINYTVNHYQQNINGDPDSQDNTNYSLVESETFTGTIGDDVIPEVKTYTGFTSPSTISETIAEDGSTLVNYYYTRNKYYLDVNGVLDGTSGGNITNYGTVDIYVNGEKVATSVSDFYQEIYYGSTYQIKNIICLEGKVYSGYNGELIGVIGTSKVSVSLIFDSIESSNYSYTGNVETFIAPADGIYKLETWGAQGGTVSSVSGGKGGYSVGYIYLEKGDELYVCVGSTGSNISSGSTSLVYGTGGYNGGGNPGSCRTYHYAGSGGGATHIATTNRGVLASYKDYQDEVLIVAGGGGGGFYNSNYSVSLAGGAGGGSTGGSAGYYGGGTKAGATQTTGYAFGQGGYPSGDTSAGGGGGWYGGYGTAGSGGGAGSGGSGYIGGVPEITYNGTTYSPSTTNGVQSGNGKAQISLVSEGTAAVSTMSLRQIADTVENVEETNSESGFSLFRLFRGIFNNDASE